MRAFRLHPAHGFAFALGCCGVLPLAALLICACRPVVAPAVDVSTAAKIDAIIERTMETYQAPGFALCVVRDGQIVYQKVYGLADVAAGRPYTPQSVSIQASVTKPQHRHRYQHKAGATAPGDRAGTAGA